MNLQIWDGEMDVGWEGLKQKLLKTSDAFSESVLRCAEFSCNPATQALVNKDSLEKFSCVVELLAENLEDAFYHVHEDLDDNSISSLRLKSWIVLGSALEVSLQVFLSIYITDYEKSQWQQWVDFAAQEAKDVIFDAINKLVSDKTILPEQGRSLKNAIRDEIKEHMKVHPVDRVMLDELIQFFSKNEIFDTDDIEEMRFIQLNRNCIHAFMERQIGNWYSLQYSIRFFVYLMELILSKLPDCEL